MKYSIPAILTIVIAAAAVIVVILIDKNNSKNDSTDQSDAFTDEDYAAAIAADPAKEVPAEYFESWEQGS